MKSYDYEKYRKRFDFWEIVPQVSMTIVLVLFFTWGIVDTLVLKSVRYISRDDYIICRGSLGLESGFCNWLIWMLIGAAISAIVLFVARRIVCYKILVISNLEQITCTLDEIKSMNFAAVNKNSISENSFDTDEKSKSQKSDKRPIAGFYENRRKE